MNNKNLKTWPEQIYLQAGDDGEGLPPYKEAKEDCITWCADSVVDYEVKYIRADLLDQANVTIAELRAEVEGPSIDYQQYITNLENKILGLSNEVERLKKEKKWSYENAAQAAALQAEMEKLRAAVPEDVEKKLGELEVTCCIGGMHGAAPFTLEQERKDLLALIGALIGRSREERKRDLIDGYFEGFDSIGTPADAEECAERILGEGK